MRLKHETLCAELTATLKSYLRWIDPGPAAGKGLLERLRGAPGSEDAPKVPAPTVVHDLTSEHAETTKSTIDFAIEGTADAESALDIWFKEVENAPERQLFVAKLGRHGGDGRRCGLLPREPLAHHPLGRGRLF